MFLRISLTLLTVLVIFLAYIGTHDARFHYSTTEVIHAPVVKVFPYLSDFKLGSQWSPFEAVDPDIKRDYLGNSMTFSGNKEAGSGSLEILKIVPNEAVDIRLIMSAPIAVNNIVTYRVKAVEGGTQLTWAIEGENGYFMKLMGFFMNMEKMMQDKFKLGISNLKKIVEK